MPNQTTPITESKNFIILDKYTREWEAAQSYQSEAALEREFIEDLVNQGYDFLPALNTPEAMLANVRVQLQSLNTVQFSDPEWRRFVETYLDKPSDGITQKTRKIHDDYIHDFVFDDGTIQKNKKNGPRNLENVNHTILSNKDGKYLGLFLGEKRSCKGIVRDSHYRASRDR
jgi:type I restriction enzyme R subunit